MDDVDPVGGAGSQCVGERVQQVLAVLLVHVGCQPVHVGVAGVRFVRVRNSVRHQGPSRPGPGEQLPGVEIYDPVWRSQIACLGVYRPCRNGPQPRGNGCMLLEYPVSQGEVLDHGPPTGCRRRVVDELQAFIELVGRYAAGAVQAPQLRHVGLPRPPQREIQICGPAMEHAAAGTPVHLDLRRRPLPLCCQHHVLTVFTQHPDRKGCRTGILTSGLQDLLDPLHCVRGVLIRVRMRFRWVIGGCVAVRGVLKPWLAVC